MNPSRAAATSLSLTTIPPPVGFAQYPPSEDQFPKSCVLESLKVRLVHPRQAASLEPGGSQRQVRDLLGGDYWLGRPLDHSDRALGDVRIAEAPYQSKPSDDRNHRESEHDGYPTLPPNFSHRALTRLSIERCSPRR